MTVFPKVMNNGTTATDEWGKKEQPRRKTITMRKQKSGRKKNLKLCKPKE